MFGAKETFVVIILITKFVWESSETALAADVIRVPCRRAMMDKG